MTKLRFLGDVSLFGGITLALLAGGFCYWLYRQETLRSGLPYGRLLPWLRSVAVALIVLMLTGPTLQHRWREGNPGEMTIIIDDSASMGLTDGKSEPRFVRAVDGLLHEDPDLLPKLAESFEVKLVRGSSRQTTDLWSSTIEMEGDLPESSAAWLPSAFGDSTNLGEFLDHDQSSVIVLLTDGRVNHGSTLVEAAQRVPYGQRRIFTVGYGQATAPEDLAIATIEHPDRLFRRDSLTGKLVIRDTMPAGQSYRIQAWHRESMVWEQRLTTVGTGQRSVAFSFPVEKLVEAEAHSARENQPALNVEISSIPIKLDFRIADCPGEANATNNQREVQVWGDLHRSRVLLLDGRSRWESRYLKNLFERDPFWEINAVIAEPAEVLGGEGRLPTGKAQGKFPDSRDEMMNYDLVILGELPARALSHEQQRWLVDFVVESGGGLIAIDGRRESWMAPELEMLTTLLPVRRLPSKLSDAEELTAIQLTPSGRSLAALNIDDPSSPRDGDLWKTLPPLRWLADSDPIPGSEVLAIDTSETDLDKARPVFVTRLHGAGRVFYSSTDETWRWRYKVADTIHTRLWNQIARWIMRTPYVVDGEFVSLDAGRMTYKPGQAVEIRCRLKREDATPLVEADVEATLQRDGQTELILSLTADSEVPGVYRGTATNLPSGSYTVSVSASGVPRDATAVETRFMVAQKDSDELNEQTSDMETLRRIAELTGGKCIPENEISSLLDELMPLSQGRIVESETLLWQSYAWFIPILVCLSIEWWIRKRVGLI